LIQGSEAENSTFLNEVDVRKPSVVSISQTSEKRRLYSLLYDLIISNPGLKATTSNASPG
jgi:hypothetical protein